MSDYKLFKRLSPLDKSLMEQAIEAEITQNGFVKLCTECESANRKQIERMAENLERLKQERGCDE